MKSTLLSFAAGVIMITFTVNAAAQQPKYLRMYITSGLTAPAEDADTARTSTNETARTAASSTTEEMKTINKKAVKNFSKEFGSADDVSWFKISNGFAAYFTLNGIRVRSHFDKKGNWMYTTQSYGEKQLPADIRKAVRRMYYDFSITGADEIHVNDKIVYLIHIKDEKYFKTIRVCDDDMDEIDSFLSAN